MAKYGFHTLGHGIGVDVFQDAAQSRCRGGGALGSAGHDGRVRTRGRTGRRAVPSYAAALRVRPVDGVALPRCGCDPMVIPFVGRICPAGRTRGRCPKARAYSRGGTVV
ncbi:hypothetical protein GCM10011578_028900 [Streptomyces fuscichromogenes]|uniref:Uncharacterized protein n=1 Tax=Streptomyces fuscichromogenes TaxID=1324013 RepID=A0A917XBP4_9ACTN|nr:hypothetical protein GCM10011578_028900 [Streptomyces fuscichromogenes]